MCRRTSKELGFPTSFRFDGLSVHEPTRYTPHFLVFGYELSLPLHLMLSPPPSGEPDSLNNGVLWKQNAFRQMYELVRRNATAQQRRRNKCVHGSTYKEGENVLLHYPVVPVGKSPKLCSPCQDHNGFLYCLNDVNYRIRGISTGKIRGVHYDRMKRDYGPIPVV